MALSISVGSGATVATEQIASQHYGYNKIVDGSSGATVGWMIDSGANASGAGHVFLRGNATLSDSKGFIGLVTVGGGSLAISGTPNVAPVGNVTLSDSKGFIGLVTVGGIGTVTLADPKGFIGLTSVSGFTNPLPVTGTFFQSTQPVSWAGNVTLDAGSKTGIAGNVTLSDSKGFIGLVSVGGGTIAISGTANVAPIGNITLSDSKGFIGLVTTQAADPKGFVGLVTLGGGTAWTDPKAYIGLVTITGSLSAAAGNVTLDAGSKTGIVGNVTLSDAKTFIGLVSIGGGPVNILGNVTLSDSKGFIGSVSVSGFANPLPVSGTFWQSTQPVSWAGNVTISDSKGYIGLVTATLAGGNATVLPFGQFLNQASLISLASGGFGPLSVDQYGRLVVNINSNVTLSDPKTYIGLTTVTLDNSRNIGIAGNVTLSDPIREKK